MAQKRKTKRRLVPRREKLAALGAGWQEWGFDGEPEDRATPASDKPSLKRAARTQRKALGRWRRIRGGIEIVVYPEKA